MNQRYALYSSVAVCAIVAAIFVCSRLRFEKTGIVDEGLTQASRSSIIAARVSEATHAEIIYREGDADVHIDVKDKEWLARLVQILSESKCLPENRSMWMSYPVIKLMKGDEEIVDLMYLGSILRHSGVGAPSDSLVEKSTTNAIATLVASKLPTKS